MSLLLQALGEVRCNEATRTGALNAELRVALSELAFRDRRKHHCLFCRRGAWFIQARAGMLRRGASEVPEAHGEESVSSKINEAREQAEDS